MIYFVTSNKHKYEEISKILQHEIEMLHIPYPEIQANSLEEVVEYGINYLKNRINGPFFIEDSGLFIQALKGFPGVFSSYVFKCIGNKGILKLMEGVIDRKAQFMSVIGFYNGGMYLFRGISEGKIAEEERGDRGFGYDPIFIPNGSQKTFGEMEIEEKNKFSHRGKAAIKLKQFLENLL